MLFDVGSLLCLKFLVFENRPLFIHGLPSFPAGRVSRMMVCQILSGSSKRSKVANKVEAGSVSSQTFLLALCSFFKIDYEIFSYC